MFLAVSMNVSPLDRLETLALKSCTSADSRLAARLKLVRVRVEFSKNRLKTIRPCSAGTFFRLRVEISVNDSAVSRIATISSRDSSSRPSKCLRFQVIGGAFAWSAVMIDTETPSLGPARNLPSRQPDDLVLRIDRADPDPDALVALGRHFKPHDVGLDGELAVPAIDQDRESDARGPAQVADRVHRRADGPPGEEDVVDQDDLHAVDLERDLGPPQDGPTVPLPQVVAIERDVDRPDEDLLAHHRRQESGQPPGDRHTPR